MGHFHRESWWVERQYKGPQLVSYSQPHLSDIEKAGGYIRFPNWQSGFSINEFSKSGEPHPHILRFQNNELVFAGKEYAL
jgi:hypothetical protein